MDDTLAVFDNKENALLFLKYLNGLRPSIKFTMKCEEDDKLAFLDLLIIKSKGNVELTIYRKPTHSGVFTHFNSFIPHRYKVTLVKTLICRAYRHCSSWHLFHAEIECITDMLMNNGYNECHIKSIVGIFLDRCFNKDSGDEPKSRQPALQTSNVIYQIHAKTARPHIADRYLDLCTNAFRSMSAILDLHIVMPPISSNHQH